MLWLLICCNLFLSEYEYDSCYWSSVSWWGNCFLVRFIHFRLVPIEFDWRVGFLWWSLRSWCLLTTTAQDYSEHWQILYKIIARLHDLMHGHQYLHWFNQETVKGYCKHLGPELISKSSLTSCISLLCSKQMKAVLVHIHLFLKF